jgi:hypothetical protein
MDWIGMKPIENINDKNGFCQVKNVELACPPAFLRIFRTRKKNGMSGVKILQEGVGK